MGYIDRLKACHTWRPENYRPFALQVDKAPLGWVTHAFADRLRGFPKTFAVSEAAVTLRGRYGDFASRSAVLEEAVRALHAAGEIPKWRGEDYGISRRWGDTPLFRMERGAVPLFGLPAFGVHANGYVATHAGTLLWVGKRAKTKTRATGKPTPLIAGA